MIPRLFIHTAVRYGMNESHLILEMYDQEGEVIKDIEGKMHFETIFKQKFKDTDPLPFIHALRNLEGQLIRHYEAVRCKERKEMETMLKQSNVCAHTLKLAS